MTQFNRNHNAVEDIGSGNTSGLKTNTSQASMSLVETDSIAIRVHANDFSPPTTLKDIFTTEQLGAESGCCNVDGLLFVVSFVHWRNDNLFIQVWNINT